MNESFTLKPSGAKVLNVVHLAMHRARNSFFLVTSLSWFVLPTHACVNAYLWCGPVKVGFAAHILRYLFVPEAPKNWD